MYEEVSLLEGLLRIVAVVLIYYMGTRGVIVLTRRFAGRTWRRALVSLSLAVLFAPSVVPFGAHGGHLPVPAWVATVVYMTENAGVGVVGYGVVPTLVSWAVFFAVASVVHLMSNNKKNNKVDAHGKET
jgi:hypothetical protein